MAVKPQGVGRNPLDKESDTVVTTVRLTRAIRARITGLVGETAMAEFIRSAVESELRRRERAGQTPPTLPDMRTKAERAKRGRS